MIHLDKQLSLHFNINEFRCKCCNEVKVNNALLYLLEAIREHFKKPVIITSGYRCEKHNKKVGGSINSQHLKGFASDIIVAEVEPFEVYSYCEKINKYGGLGKYDTFTHVDVCIKPRGRRF